MHATAQTLLQHACMSDRGRIQPRHWALGAIGVGMGGLLTSTVAFRRRRADLVGRVVLVTGGSRGLGFLMAREYGRRGARVVLVARSEDDLAEATERLWLDGVDVHAVRCDVRDAAAVADAVERAVAWGGRLDVLVNNAGVITVGPIDHTPLDDYANSLATHFWAPVHLVRACLPHLRHAGDARIVNVASIGGRIGVPHLAAYSAGKFALVGWSEALRAELAVEGIAVTTATPGLMRTGSHGRAQVRGRHAEEARWFAVTVATSLTSMHAARAAQQIVTASLAGRARVTPGWQARLGDVLEGMAPAWMAAAMAVTARLLPAPAERPGGDVARAAGQIGFGWLEPLLPRDPIDSRAGHPPLHPARSTR